MIHSGAVCLAYETVERIDGSLPLLIPMSEVAGRMAIQEGAKYLEKPLKGRGILLGGVPGVKPAKVLILGGGVVGTNAAKIAAGMGADVTIMDLNINRLRYLDDVMPKNVHTIVSNEYTIREMITECRSHHWWSFGTRSKSAKTNYPRHAQNHAARNRARGCRG